MTPKNFDQFANSYRQRNSGGGDFHRPSTASRFVGALGGIFVALIVIFALALAGFFLFQNKNNSKWGSEEIKFEISGTTQAPAGEEASYSISLNNLASSPLSQTEVTINWPENFVFTSAQPSFDQVLQAGGTWKIGSLDSYQKKTLTVKGRIFGKSSDHISLSAALAYQPQNFSSTFSQTASCDTEINGSLLEAAWDFPERIVSNDETDGQIKITPPTDFDKIFSGLLVVMEYPAGFTFTAENPSSTPSDRDNSLVWKIDQLKKESIINFKGQVSGGNNEKKSLHLKIVPLNSDGQELPALIDWDKNVYLTNDPVVISTTVNQATSNFSAGWGDTLSFKVKFHNASDQKIENSILNVSFNNPSWLDWDTLKVGEGSADSIDQGGVLVFNGTQISALKSLDTDQEGNVSFSFKLKDSAPASADISSGLIMSAKMTAGDFTVSAPDSIIHLSSNVSLKTDARYYSDDKTQVGSGPIPPKAGEITNYQIRLFVSNSGNSLKNARVVLKPGLLVDWAGQSTQSTGDLIYDSETRLVTWEIGKMDSAAELNATFMGALKPTSDYVGNSLVLVSEATLTAEDTITGQTLTFKIPAKITTALKGDPLAAGKGVVVE